MGTICHSEAMNPDRNPERLQTTLGRTGLRCSVVGFGCGGINRLGLRQGGGIRQAAALVRKALDQGVSYIDTAKRYGTEPAVGLALRGRRDGVTVATKVDPLTPDGRVDPGFITDQIDDSLRVLGLDTIDVMHLHCVKPGDYRRVIDGCMEPMRRAQAEGKIRYLGISEFWGEDLNHEMLRMALRDDLFDVMLVGCNLLNPSAARTVIPMAAERGVGTVLMFAVRRALAEADLLRDICMRLIESRALDAAAIDPSNPLGFLLADGSAKTVTEAAYRYCRHIPGVDVVLTGTRSEAHLLENITAIEGRPLPPSHLSRLETLFGDVRSLTGES